MKLQDFIKKALIILFWIGIWAIAAVYINKPLLLPTPYQVAQRILILVLEKDFWYITMLSLVRITCGIIFAVLLGTFIAVLIHKSKFLYVLFSPILTIIKTTPVASFIILVLIWLGRDIVPAVISAMIVLPVICNNITTGLNNMDRNILEMAAVYRIPIPIQFKRIVLPSVMPYFLSALQTSIGVGWKAGIAAEVLTVPAHSIGKMIFESKIYMETIDLFAWTVVVILISLLIEKIIIGSLKQIGKNHLWGDVI